MQGFQLRCHVRRDRANVAAASARQFHHRVLGDVECVILVPDRKNGLFERAALDICQEVRQFYTRSQVLPLPFVPS